ncbi:MAG: GNAT family N-acetyltransferase [Aquaticitalea sp.]
MSVAETLKLINSTVTKESMTIKIRKATENDSGKIWILMRDLAIFEKYIETFAITKEIVHESGFQKNPPDFYCFVAEENEHIAGILIYYFLPYTAQNRPAIYMKELFVDDKYRGQKIGEQLMNALKVEAKQNNCTQIKWTVAPWNQQGIKFYERLGANENKEWLNFELNL